MSFRSKSKRVALPGEKQRQMFFEWRCPLGLKEIGEFDAL